MLKLEIVRYRPLYGMDESDAYCVGSNGSVWSRWAVVGLGQGRGIINVIGETWHRLSGDPNPDDGHVRVILSPGRRRRFVHRLVLLAFVGPCPPGMECCHEDGIPDNNAQSNLRWDTKKANHADAVGHGRRPAARYGPHPGKPWGLRHGMAKLKEADIVEIRERHKAGESVASIGRAKGVSRNQIWRIVTGRSWARL